MLPPVEIAHLPPAAQKVLDPGTPAPLRNMAAKGVVPGLRPADLCTVLVVLASGEGELANVAKQTLANLPQQLLGSALTADLEPIVIATLADQHMARADVMEKLLAMPRIAEETVENAAERASEPVAELIAVNEQRLLAHPTILSKLYMNAATRMSTADRILELAVRNHLELRDIPAYKELAIAIGQTLIAEPTEELNPDDILFKETLEEGRKLALNPELEDTHVVDDEGEERVAEKVLPLHMRLAQMTPAQKIRTAMLGSSAERLLLMRDTNRMVAAAAIRSPAIQVPEVVRVTASRTLSEEVLRIIANNREWLQNYQIKLNLVLNPRTPFVFSARIVPQLREHELKALAKSKNVPAPIAMAAKQQLLRKKQ
jgi:hypothetical protein